MKSILTPIITAFILLMLAYLLKYLSASLDGDALAAGVSYAVTTVHIVLWFVAAWFLKRLIQSILTRYLGVESESDTPKLLFDVISVFLFFGAIIGVVGAVFDKSVDGLLTASGLLTGVLAFAIRDLIADIFAGIALAIEKPFKAGDWLQFGEGRPSETGRVIEMNWRATRLLTVQGRMLVFPNSTLAGQKLINLSRPERCFRTVKQVCVDFSVPPNRVVEIILSAIKATPGIVEPQTPLILIDELNERGTVFSLHFWVPDYPAMFLIERQVMINVINFLNQAGYSPAYPKNELDLSWRHRREIKSDLDISTLLKRVALFQALSNDEIDQLKSKVAVVSYPADVVIVNEHEQGDSLFVVFTGLARVTIQTDDGEREIGKIRPGEVFGEMSLLTGSPRTASVSTVTETAVVEIKRDHLQPIMEANPSLIDKLSKIETSRSTTHESGVNVPAQDRDEVNKIGLNRYLKRQISKFFGLGK
ncbi:MAG: mechanosensitive ion channel [Rhodospirillales bacterium]|nr:mechanosensitive ion channel [Rhodospirillales bacterium]